MSQPRTFFLASTPDEGQAQLLPADREHALKVLRVRAGDVLLGIDGRGRAWELEVVAAERRRLELRSRGPACHEPAPGSSGAALPWIEACTPLPKGSRAEALFGALTQLGVARLVPLLTERCESQARSLPASREARLQRASQEALKQCGRLWMPEIAHPQTLASLLKNSGRRVVLDPRATLSLSEHLGRLDSGSFPTREEPLQLIFGPEGGLCPSELDDCRAAKAPCVRISVHTLRMETAVQAALAIALEGWLGNT